MSATNFLTCCFRGSFSANGNNHDLVELRCHDSAMRKTRQTRQHSQDPINNKSQKQKPQEQDRPQKPKSRQKGPKSIQMPQINIPNAQRQRKPTNKSLSWNHPKYKENLHTQEFQESPKTKIISRRSVFHEVQHKHPKKSKQIHALVLKSCIEHLGRSIQGFKGLSKWTHHVARREAGIRPKDSANAAVLDESQAGKVLKPWWNFRWYMIRETSYSI